MLGRQFAALGEAAAGEDVSVGRAHVAFVRTVLSYAVEEGFHREDVLVWELRGTVFRRVCGVHPMESFPGLIECSLGRPIIDIITTALVQRCSSFQKQRHNFQPITRRLLRVGVQKANREKERRTPAAETTAAPTPGTTPVPITEETDERRRRRLSVFSASARRKRAAGHLRQVEKRHAHDPHPGVTGQLEYDHPVSYEVAVAKKPQMILNSEVMGDEQPVPP